MIQKVKAFMFWIIVNRTIVYHLIVLFFVILSSFFALLFSKLYYSERDEFLIYRKRVITEFEDVHTRTLKGQAKLSMKLDTLKLNQDSIKDILKDNR